MAEFTGERVIPGQVDADLLNEHVARYAFAARMASGKRVLDAGCGAGYGSAELASAAASVTGMDCSEEALEFARSNYNLPNLRFEAGSCEAMPYQDGSFDLVVAFEVIEHLENWRGFLREARRVLAGEGELVVSTPNKLYYTESRGTEGANPFHVHEFDFDEFRAELKAVFPYITMFLENHVEGVTFQPYWRGEASDAPAHSGESGTRAEVRVGRGESGTRPEASVGSAESARRPELRVDGGEPPPSESHFFVAVCSSRAPSRAAAFVYVPRTANVLRERERHIALLEGELTTKNEWLVKALAEHQSLMSQFEEQKAALERSNRWADQQNREIQDNRARIVELQEELEREHAAAVETAAGYEAKVADLERDVREKTEWAQDVETRLTAEVAKQTADLAKAVDALHHTEKELEERTAWALRLQKEAEDLSQQLTLVRASRWMKLGRKVGLGPVLPQI